MPLITAKSWSHASRCKQPDRFPWNLPRQAISALVTFPEFIRFGASSYEPGWPGWLGYRDEFCLGFIWEISARFPRWEKVKDPGNEFWRQIRETKQTWRNTKILTFGPILPSVTLKAVSLQLNGMLMMWKIQQAMQDDAIWTARIHPAAHPGNRDEVFIWQNFQPAYRDLGNRASPPSHINTSNLLQRI